MNDESPSQYQSHVQVISLTLAPELERKLAEATIRIGEFIIKQVSVWRSSNGVINVHMPSVQFRRLDATFGFEREETSTGSIYVLAGVRRNGPPPEFILQSDPESLRFELLDDQTQLSVMIFTKAELGLWNNLPSTFNWTEAEALANSKRLLSETLRKAQANGLLEHNEKQPYRKRLAPREITEQAA